MSTAVTTPNETLASLLRHPNYANRFKEVLGDRAGQFVSSVLSVGATMKDVDPPSIIASAMIAASLDLPINKNLGFAWIVPYMDKGRKVAQFQMGYKGFIQLALRTGRYSRMNVRGVNAEAVGGFDELGEPIIHWNLIDETKDTVGYVFAFQLVNGFTKICYWTKTKVEAHAQKYSQSYRGKFDSPWKSHFDAMAMKTVVKNELSRWGVMSVEFQQALDADQAVEAAEGFDYVDNPATEPVKKPPLITRIAVPESNHPFAGSRSDVVLPEDGWPEQKQNLELAEPPGEAVPGLGAGAATTPSLPPTSEPLKVTTPAQPSLDSQQPAPAYAALAAFLDRSEIPFDGFKRWLDDTGRDKQAGFVASVVTDINQLPLAFATALASDSKALAKCARLYGKQST